MLTEFSLSNFKSYKNGRLPLGPLTVLIGANASGKSNVIEGLRFLSWLADGQKISSIEHSLNSTNQVLRGRVNDLCYQGLSNFTISCSLNSTSWDNLGIALVVHGGDIYIDGEQIFKSSDRQAILYSIDESFEATRYRNEVCVFYNPFEDSRELGMDWPSVVCYDQRAIFTQLDSPNLFEKNEVISREIIPETVQEYQRVLQNIIFFDPIPAKMRDYSQKSDHKKFIESGSNLSSVLFRLWENQPENQQLILNFIQSLPEQAIDGLDFLIGPRDEVMVRLSETFGNTQRFCEAALLSDGTLRVLAIAAAMLSATEGSLVVIEEIDNGVHPSRAKHLLANIRDIAERRKLRVLLSTHNPALMDALPDEALGDVVFCYRDPEQGDSRLIKLGELYEFPELIVQGSLGQLVTTGVVDRFAKFPNTPEEKKRKAKEWLARLREYSND